MHRASKFPKTLRGFVVVAALLCVLLLLSVIASGFARDYFDRKTGSRLVEKVEQYHATHGRYPANLAEMGIEEKDEGPYYQFDGRDNSYKVWFGRSLGESFGYDSRNKTWN